MKTADCLYHEKMELVEKEIEIFKIKLYKMNDAQRMDKLNYGFSGNAGHVLELLQEINEFMSNY